MIETALEMLIAFAIASLVALASVGAALSLIYKVNAFKVPL